MMSFEECQKWGKKMMEEKEALSMQNEKIYREELLKKNIDVNSQKITKPKYDHHLAPNDGIATVLYVIGMISCLIFKDFWIPWIILTVIYGKFITRHDKD